MHTLEGQWNATSKNIKTSATFTDVTGDKEEVSVRALDVQDEWESRKLWEGVTTHLVRKEYGEATKSKVAIEQMQREEAAERKRKGVK